ncbi:Ff.00g104930.m01.CDS01 [Fusarium sp. VM40]|nr:Ff.00g104930.m01.CDS01 [Fusarium sp. VM40]
MDEARERVLAERRRIMEEDMASRYGPGRYIIPPNEPFPAGVPRSSWPTPVSPFIPRRVPQTLIASALGQRRNAISLGRLPPRRAERLLSGRSFGHISGRSSGQVTRRSPPASNSYTLSSDMPDIGHLNMNDEGESSRRAPRRSNQRETPPQVTGDQVTQETDRVWESDIPRQSVPRTFPDGHMMTNTMTGSFAGTSLPESEEEMSSDDVSTAAENGSEVDELEFRLRFSFMDGVEHTGQNPPKKD